MPPPLRVPDGALEALKALGLVLMTSDHINKYLFNGTSDLAFNAGRVALPIFCFVLAVNLARVGPFRKVHIGGPASALRYTARYQHRSFSLWGACYSACTR